MAGPPTGGPHARHPATAPYAELDAIGVVRSEDDTHCPAVSRVDSKRRRMLTEIAAYREEHGNALVPANYVTHDGEQVGQWLYRAVKKWRADALSDDERGHLAVLGVSPSPRPRGPRTSASAPDRLSVTPPDDHKREARI